MSGQNLSPSYSSRYMSLSVLSSLMPRAKNVARLSKPIFSSSSYKIGSFAHFWGFRVYHDRRHLWPQQFVLVIYWCYLWTQYHVRNLYSLVMIFSWCGSMGASLILRSVHAWNRKCVCGCQSRHDFHSRYIHITKIHSPSRDQRHVHRRIRERATVQHGRRPHLSVCG